ncbi:TIGR03643 family protein [Ekhidna sp.]
MELTERDKNRIIEMAWEDRTPFDAIKFQFGLPEKEVIKLMRSTLKRSSFNLWRKRVNSGPSQKHLKKQPNDMVRFNLRDKNRSASTKSPSDNV